MIYEASYWNFIERKLAIVDAICGGHLSHFVWVQSMHAFQQDFVKQMRAQMSNNNASVINTIFMLDSGIDIVLQWLLVHQFQS